jgi:hypothetical protein
MGSLKLGKPDVAMDAPSHVRGIHQGNERGNYEKMPGHTPSGTSTAERSTGVSAELEEPIAPGMPNLPPA